MHSVSIGCLARRRHYRGIAPSATLCASPSSTGGNMNETATANDAGVRTTPPFRADHVGSFLRPKFLLDARQQFRSGAIDAAKLRAVEDEAIRGVVKIQE